MASKKTHRAMSSRRKPAGQGSPSKPSRRPAQQQESSRQQMLRAWKRAQSRLRGANGSDASAALGELIIKHRESFPLLAEAISHLSPEQRQRILGLGGSVEERERRLQRSPFLKVAEEFMTEHAELMRLLAQ